jgi:hypothetical protein
MVCDPFKKVTKRAREGGIFDDSLDFPNGDIGLSI